MPILPRAFKSPLAEDFREPEALRERFFPYLYTWLFVAIALGTTTLLLGLTEHKALLASFGGSCVILFGMPDSEMAKMRSFLGGHLLSTVVGLVFFNLGYATVGGSSEVWVIAAVATALILMMLTRTIHSPAGANPVVIFAEGANWHFLLSPVLVGLIILAITAIIAKPLISRTDVAR